MSQGGVLGNNLLIRIAILQSFVNSYAHFDLKRDNIPCGISPIESKGTATLTGCQTSSDVSVLIGMRMVYTVPL